MKVQKAKTIVRQSEEAAEKLAALTKEKAALESKRHILESGSTEKWNQLSAAKYRVTNLRFELDLAEETVQLLEKELAPSNELQSTLDQLSAIRSKITAQEKAVSKASTNLGEAKATLEKFTAEKLQPREEMIAKLVAMMDEDEASGAVSFKQGKRDLACLMVNRLGLDGCRERLAKRINVS